MDPIAKLNADMDHFLHWSNGNQDAAVLLLQLFYCCHLWDDLTDGDWRPLEDIHLAFHWLAVDIPANPFYRAHFDRLNPVIANTILEWHAANQLEQGEDHERDIAYTLRCSVLSIAQQIAYLAGGYQWALQVGPDIRRYGQVETLEQYKEGLKCQIPSPA